jgi:hypothetical protein
MCQESGYWKENMQKVEGIEKYLTKTIISNVLAQPAI